MNPSFRCRPPQRKAFSAAALRLEHEDLMFLFLAEGLSIRLDSFQIMFLLNCLPGYQKFFGRLIFFSNNCPALPLDTELRDLSSRPLFRNGSATGLTVLAMFPSTNPFLPSSTRGASALIFSIN